MPGAVLFLGHLAGELMSNEGFSIPLVGVLAILLDV